MNTNMMAALLGCLCAPVLLFVPADVSGDVVKFESNDWSSRRPMIWTAALDDVDKEGVLHFSYRDEGGTRIPFEVHKTRIYSIRFNDSDSVHRPFPATRADLREPLPTRRKRRKIEIDRTVLDVVENGECILAWEGADRLGVLGDFESMSEGTATLVVLLNAREAECRPPDDQKIEVSRDDLKAWVR